MPDVSFTNLLVVAAVAVLAPLAVGFAPQLRVPAVVLEIIGYLVTLVLGYGAGATFTAAGWVSQPLLIAITLSATSPGLVVPVLKDASQVRSRVGQTALAAASVADFAAIVLLVAFTVLAERFGLESIWAPSWPGPSSAWSTATPPPTPTSAPSSTRSATGS